MTEPLRNHGDHGDATAVTAVQAPQWHRTSGVTGVQRWHYVLNVKTEQSVFSRRKYLICNFHDVSCPKLNVLWTHKSAAVVECVNMYSETTPYVD